MNKLVILLILISILGCEKKSENTYQIETPVFLRNNEIFNSTNCFSIGNIDATNGFVINDSETYKAYEDSMRIYLSNNDCDTATLVNFDFNKSTLIGIKVGYSASDSLSREIIVDNENQEIKYKIDIAIGVNPEHYLIYYLDLNLALIEKIPEDYDVVFQVNEHN